MKKIVISVTILLISFLTIFLFINSKENKKDIENNNISIILETEEGNIESNSFPSEEEYDFDKITCQNTNNVVVPTFNTDTWKLNVSIVEDVIDGNFNCNIYFKEVGDIATKIIKEKYNNGSNEIIGIEQPSTEQTSALTEYRYSGGEVNNYVLFNDELWRIIGVFSVDDGTGNYEERIKLIREENIGSFSWDTSEADINDGWGVNEWGGSDSYNGADVMRLLNPGYESESVNNSLYWNSESGSCYYTLYSVDTYIIPCNFTNTGLKSVAKNMIDNVLWYTGPVDNDILSSEIYISERKSTAPEKEDNIPRTTSWIGSVGLIYLSDYIYASKDCYETIIPQSYNEEQCTSSNWLYATGYHWTISPHIDTYTRTMYISTTGSVGRNIAYYHDYVRPSVYLKPDVKITRGDGSENNPYKLKYS